MRSQLLDMAMEDPQLLRLGPNGRDGLPGCKTDIDRELKTCKLYTFCLFDPYVCY